MSARLRMLTGVVRVCVAAGKMCWPWMVAGLWLWLCPTVFGSPLSSGQPDVSGSFTTGGANVGVAPLRDTDAQGLRIYGSWRRDPEHTGNYQSAKFSTPTTQGQFELFVSGYPNEDHNFLGIQRLDTGETLRIYVDPPPHERWQKVRCVLPAAWRNQPVRIVAWSKSAGHGDWIAFSEPFHETHFPSELGRALKCVGQMSLQWGVLCIIGLFVVRVSRRFRDVPAIPVAFGGVGLLAYTAYWVFVWSLRAGHVFSWAVMLAGAVTLLVEMRKRGWRFLFARPELWLWLMISILYLSFGLLYGDLDYATAVARTRYFHWQSDNELPYVYAAKILTKPLSWEWDNWNVFARPPLQTGFFLLLSRAFAGWLSYQTLGVLLQASVIPAIWRLLECARLSRFARVMALATTIFSVFVLVNSFYVWPKLLAATYCFICLIALFVEQVSGRMRWLLGGSAMALAMLSHGGSVFGVLGLLTASFLISRTWRTERPWRTLAMACALGVVIHLPWTWYSGHSGRRTDQLFKWHLAGTIEQESDPVGAPVGSAIWKAYRSMPLATVVKNKRANLEMQLMFNLSSPTWWRAPWNTIAKAAIDDTFGSTEIVVLAPLLAMVACLPLIFGRRLRHFERQPAVAIGGLGLTGTVVWCLVMFGPAMYKPDLSGGNAMATLPQGSYFPVLCLLVGLAAAVAECSKVAAWGMLLLQVALFVCLGTQGVTAVHDGPGSWPYRPIQAGMAIVAGLAFLAVCMLLLVIGGNQRRSGGEFEQLKEVVASDAALATWSK